MPRVYTDNSFTGIRGMRFRFMKENLPELLRELEEKDKLDEYLDGVLRRYREQLPDLYQKTLLSCGATAELRDRDMGEWLRRADQAERMAYEILDEQIVRER